jgi:hypothetical protein
MVKEALKRFETPYLERTSLCNHDERASGPRTMIHVAPPEHIRRGESPVIGAATTRRRRTTPAAHHPNRAHIRPWLRQSQAHTARCRGRWEHGGDEEY